MTNAWVIRSGRYGERDDWAIANQCSGGGWGEVPDLTSVTSREQLGELLAEIYSDRTPGAVANSVGQVWAIRDRIKPGDIMVMPLKTTQKLAIGRVTSGYRYLTHETDPEKRHVVGVDWIHTDVSRSKVKQDLLYTLGSALSVFSPTRGHAVERLSRLLSGQDDPGLVAFVSGGSSGNRSAIVLAHVNPEEVLEQSEGDEVDILEVARDRISARIEETFVGHDLTGLIKAVLEVDGFTCQMAPPGPDRGIDIVAGKGPLGMDSPRIIVQVKSGGQIGDPVIRDLLGVLHSQGADQGLIVAWGGLSSAAKATVYGQQFRLRAWTAEDIVEAVLRVYDRLPEDIQTRLPLKRVWMLT
ncbi:restriction endonuclease [Arthrobacter sp. RAF14]|uniref:restriction endonuclease n=1 Tax=Arthrobacter sp. RAF14 TaxID=3233051 RepID=UPI003F8F92C6